MLSFLTTFCIIRGKLGDVKRNFKLVVNREYERGIGCMTVNREHTIMVCEEDLAGLRGLRVSARQDVSSCF